MASVGEAGAAVTKMGYRPGLDAVRGVAILLVLAGHMWLERFPGVGTHGVTMFFTLSGFLITKLLLEERDSTGRLSWSGFYRRRALRLLPVLPFAIMACAVVNAAHGYGVLAPVLTSAFYVHNLAIGWHVPEGAFNHFWSLALEEQFYALWPLTFWLIGRRRLATVCFWSLPALLVARLLLAGSFIGEGLEQSGLTRIDSLLIGCWLAFLVQRAPRRVPGWLVAAAVAMVGTFVLWTSVLARHAETFGPAVIGAATCVLILWAIALERVPAPLVWLGKRSYGIYLWHVPVIWIMWGNARPFVLAVALLVAECSWRWIEAPFLARKRSGGLVDDVPLDDVAGGQGEAGARSGLVAVGSVGVVEPQLGA